MQNYYAYDIPAALNTPLQQYLGTPDDEYNYFINVLYSVYSLPNIILPWFGGYLIDSFGTKRLLVVLSGLVCAGQVLFSMGVQGKIGWLMIFGRVLFGAGECLGVAVSKCEKTLINILFILLC